MKKVLKITGIVIGVLLLLPVVIIIVTGVINEVIGHCHTDMLLNDLTVGSGYKEVVDTYTYIGNTSGTGNHCEAQSAVLIRTRSDSDVIFWSKGFEVYRVDGIKENDSVYSFMHNKMDLPENTENLYLVIAYNEVPFPDHIKGH